MFCLSSIRNIHGWELYVEGANCAYLTKKESCSCLLPSCGKSDSEIFQGSHLVALVGLVTLCLSGDLGGDTALASTGTGALSPRALLFGE